MASENYDFNHFNYFSCVKGLCAKASTNPLNEASDEWSPTLEFEVNSGGRNRHQWRLVRTVLGSKIFSWIQSLQVVLDGTTATNAELDIYGRSARVKIDDKATPSAHQMSPYVEELVSQLPLFGKVPTSPLLFIFVVVKGCVSFKCGWCAEACQEFVMGALEAGHPSMEQKIPPLNFRHFCCMLPAICDCDRPIYIYIYT